jgi:hypothetical protein
LPAAAPRSIDPAGEQKLDRLDRRAGAFDGDVDARRQAGMGKQPPHHQIGHVVAERHGERPALQRRHARQRRVGRHYIKKAVGHGVQKPHRQAAIIKIGRDLHRQHQRLHRARGQPGAHLVGIAPDLEVGLFGDGGERAGGDGMGKRDRGAGRRTIKRQRRQLRRCRAAQEARQSEGDGDARARGKRGAAGQAGSGAAGGSLHGKLRSVGPAAAGINAL